MLSAEFGMVLLSERPVSSSAFVVTLVSFGLAIVAVIIGAVLLTAHLNRRWAAAGPTMTMRFQVGTVEMHVVSVAFTQPTERLIIVVDGTEALNQNFSAGLKLTSSVEITVGNEERHAVRVEKKRQRLYGGFNPQQFSASIDDVVVAQGESRFSTRNLRH